MEAPASSAGAFALVCACVRQLERTSKPTVLKSATRLTCGTALVIGSARRRTDPGLTDTGMRSTIPTLLLGPSETNTGRARFGPVITFRIVVSDPPAPTG
jgi:hypothetical protein